MLHSVGTFFSTTAHEISYIIACTFIFIKIVDVLLRNYVARTTIAYITGVLVEDFVQLRNLGKCNEVL